MDKGRILLFGVMFLFVVLSTNVYAVPVLNNCSIATSEIKDNEQVNFISYWSNATKVKILVDLASEFQAPDFTNCDFNTQTGCWASSGNVTVSPENATLTASSGDIGLNYWWCRVCDENNSCSETYSPTTLDTDETEILEDDFCKGSECYGGAYLQIKKSDSRHWFVKFNKTALPTGRDVDRAYLKLYMYSMFYGQCFVSAFHVYDQIWIEDVYNARSYNGTYEDRIYISSTVGWYNWTVTNAVKQDYDNASIYNISFRSDSGDGTNTEHYYYSKDYDGFNPTLQVFWNNNHSGTLSVLNHILYDDFYINSDYTFEQTTCIYGCDDENNDGVVIINASDIIVDCNNTRFVGDGTGYGVFANNFSNVSLKNCDIDDYTYDIYYLNSVSGNISNNILGGDILINYSSNCTVYGNKNASIGLVYSDYCVADNNDGGSSFSLDKSITSTGSNYIRIINNYNYFQFHHERDEKYILIDNNTINGRGSSTAWYGLSLLNVTNSNITNNLVENITGSFYRYGIYDDEYSTTCRSGYNRFINNTVRNSGKGMVVYSMCDEIIENNIFNNNTEYGFWFLGLNNPSDYDTVRKNSIKYNPTGVRIAVASQVILIDNDITGNTYDLYLDANLNNTLINTTFSTVHPSSTTGYWYDVRWYFDVNVTNATSDALQDATVTATDKNGIQAFLQTTASNGFISTQNMTEYFVNASNSTQKIYKTNYTLVTSKLQDYRNDTKSVNFTANYQENVVLLSNNFPTISWVEYVDGIDPVESSVKQVLINFSATDIDGVSDIGLATENMTAFGNTNPAITHSDLTCENYQNISNTAYFTCSLPFNYYDDAQIYNLTVRIKDIYNAEGNNTSQYFTYNILTAWNMTPTSISFGILYKGDTNILATDDPLVMENTGNDDLSNIEVNATDLIGMFNNSLVAYWRFDEVSGTTAYDISGYGNDGTLYNFDDAGQTNWTTGKYGNALYFDGSNDYIDVPLSSSLNFSGAISVCAWVYSTDNSNNHEVVAQYNSGADGEWAINNYYGAFRILVWNATNVYATSSGTFTLNTWIHVCGIYNGTHMQNYIDGSSTGFPVQVLNRGKSNTDLHIGSLIDTVNAFNGTIDDVRVYNKFLSSSEISELYNLGREWTAGNFSINTADACEGTLMITDTFTQITGASLSHGLGSIEDLYFCAEDVPFGLAKDTYDTSTNGEWTVRSLS